MYEWSLWKGSISIRGGAKKALLECAGYRYTTTDVNTSLGSFGERRVFKRRSKP